MAVKIIRILLIIVAIAAIALYVYDIAVLKKDPSENLFRAVAIIAGSVAGIAKLSVKSRGRRRSLDYYETQYAKELGSAFLTSPKERKKLVSAVRLYNENNFIKAAKLLTELKPLCCVPDDFYAVGLFLALVFTDIQAYAQAVDVYQKLISMNIASSTMYGNLGYVYSNLGDDENTLNCYYKALEMDPKNPFPQYNIAKFYFDQHELETAAAEAEKALALDSKMVQAATLLTVTYALLENSEMSEKYFHIAVANGSNPKDLKASVDFFKNGGEIR